MKNSLLAKNGNSGRRPSRWLRKISLDTILLLLLFYLSTIFLPAQEKTDLAQILNKASAYCERLKSAVFEFTCLEEISDVYEDLAGERIEQKFFYFYRILGENENISEKRFQYKKNPDICEAAEQSKNIRFYSHFSVFLPLLIMSKENQNKYAFFARPIIKEKQKYLMPIEVVAKDNTVFFKGGLVHIDVANGSIMAIEVAPHSLDKADLLLDEGKIRDIHQYEVEHNGLRFPSKTEIVYNLATRARRISHLLWHKTLFEYKDYIFFKVSLKSEVKNIEACF